MSEEVRIVYTKITDLARWPRNPKDHDLPSIRASMKRWGFTVPIGLDERTNRIVAGHGRLEVLLEMHAAGEAPPKRIKVKGSTWYAPVLRGVSFESEEEAEAYLVADNFLTEKGGWDREELAVMVAGLGSLEGTGIDDAELEELRKLAEAAIPSADAFAGSRPEDDGGDGDPEGEEEEKGPASIVVVVGPFRVKVPRQRYTAWLDKIRAKVGWEKDAIRDEIAKRLGFNE